MGVNVSISAFACGLAALIASVSISAATRHPTLSVWSSSKGITVVGRAFASRDRVVIRVSYTGASLTRRVRASVQGAFWTEFDIASTSNCSDLVVSARGQQGPTVFASHRPSVAEPCGIAPQP